MLNKLNIESKVILNNCTKMPILGFGTYLLEDNGEVAKAVSYALEVGYRSIDTAKIYENEKGVGEAINTSGIKREDIFLTTKLWNSDFDYEDALKAIDKSLKTLKLDYVDLYLLHWPVKGKFLTAYKAMEKIYSEGYAKAIGVSNFTVNHLDALLSSSDIVPAVNQLELHPYLALKDLRNYCYTKGIQVEAWGSLLRGSLFSGESIGDADFEKIGKKYGKTPAQVLLRWAISQGIVVIPKSKTKERIRENSEIFDFELSEDDMSLISKYDLNLRKGPDPENFNF